MSRLPASTSLSSAEKDALIASLMARVEELSAQVAVLSERVRALESENAALRAKLKLPPKTPDNSSTPPSHGHKASGEAGARPKGKAHDGAHRALHPNPTRVQAVRASACAHCSADVSGAAQAPVQEYDRIEIPAIKPDVTRVTLLGGVCPCCTRRFKAPPPPGLEPGSPLGPNPHAFVLSLRFTHAISFERLARLCSDLLGLAISEGALVNMLAEARSAFARQVSLIRARLLASTILQSDETSMRVGKQTWWTWVFHHADSACFVIRPSRGKDVVAEFLAGHRPDYWVSDRLGAQLGWAEKDHQFCLAHLLREAQYAIDAGDVIFAPGLRHLIGEACAIGQRRPDLADSTLRSYAARLDRQLDGLLGLRPTNAEGQKLQQVIKKIRPHLFVFFAHRDIPPTNNGSEQALRPCVVFRKVTNCFRSHWGAGLYANLRSVLETARRRTIGQLDAIRLTLSGVPLPAPP